MAAICAPARPVIDLVKTRARTLIYSTGLPPASAAAALAALDVIADAPDFAASPVRKAQRFTRACDLPLAQSPIVPIVLGEAGAALDASALLEREGFAVVAIRPPTVPAGTARLRLAFNALHPDDEIDAAGGDRAQPDSEGGGMSAVFVTATGTDIGKTFVTAGLIGHLRGQGRAVDAFKPVVSGFAMATAAASDPGQLLAALGEAVTAEAIARLSPWRYEAALSPDMAAAREGQVLPYGEILAACRDSGRRGARHAVHRRGGRSDGAAGRAPHRAATGWRISGLPVDSGGRLLSGHHQPYADGAGGAGGASGSRRWRWRSTTAATDRCRWPRPPRAIARFAPGLPIASVPRDAGRGRFCIAGGFAGIEGARPACAWRAANRVRQCAACQRQTESDLDGFL